MVLKFFHSLWTLGRSGVEREQRLLQERQQRERDAEEHRREEDADRDFTVLMVLISEELRQALEEFSRDLHDAITATRQAYELAAAEELKARRALDAVQADALILVDGRRVYFTRDGARIYGEDRRQITDAGQVAAARALREGRSAASYEDYTAASDAWASAAASTQQLATTLDRLDDLGRRMESGNMTPEDLAEAREELDAILDSLPPEGRAAYAGLQDARAAVSGNAD